MVLRNNFYQTFFIYISKHIISLIPFTIRFETFLSILIVSKRLKFV